MTQTPEPPPYGTPAGQTPPVAPQPLPQMPASVQYAAATGQKAGRTADVVLSWILFVGQILGSIALGIISIFAIFVTDSCGSTASSTVPAVCDSDYFGGVLIGYWIALLVLLVGTLIGLIVASASKRPAWPWPVGGIVLTGITTIIFFTLMSR